MLINGVKLKIVSISVNIKYQDFLCAKYADLFTVCRRSLLSIIYEWGVLSISDVAV